MYTRTRQDKLIETGTCNRYAIWADTELSYSGTTSPDQTETFDTCGPKMRERHINDPKFEPPNR